MQNQNPPASWKALALAPEKHIIPVIKSHALVLCASLLLREGSAFTCFDHPTASAAPTHLGASDCDFATSWCEKMSAQACVPGITCAPTCPGTTLTPSLPLMRLSHIVV